MTIEEFLTPRQAAERIGVAYTTVIFWIRTGRITASKVSGVYLISAAAVAAMIDARA